MEPIFFSILAVSNLHFSAPLSINNLLDDTLFESYKNSVRPVIYATDITEVQVSPTLFGILNVNEEKQMVTVSRWFQMFWQDPTLRWEPNRYNGSLYLVVEAKKLWIPDITIIEMLDYKQAVMTPQDFVTIWHNGSIQYSLNDVVDVHCEIEAARFPYDEQNCSMTYVSWEYPADSIRVKARPSIHGYVMFYEENSEWQLLAYTYDNNVTINDGQSISFDGVRFDLVFRRKARFYVLALVLPSFLITSVAIFGLFSPSVSTAEREERVTLGLTAEMAMSVVLIIVTNLMPKSDKQFPLLGKYVVYQMLMVGVGMALATTLVYVQTVSAFGVRLPQWLLCIVGIRRKKIEPLQMQRELDPSIPNGDVSSATTLTKPASQTTNEFVEKMRVYFEKLDQTLKAIQCEIESRQQQQRIVTEAAAFCFRVDICLLILFTILNVLILLIVFVTNPA